MKTIGYRPVVSAQAIIDEIAAALTPVLVPARLDQLYPFRWQPSGTLAGNRIGYLTSEGGIPTDSTENNSFQDIILMVAIRHDGTPATLQAAEATLNDIESDVWNTLVPHNAAHWNTIEPPRQSVKPGAPEGQPNWRAMYIYIRARSA